MNALSPPSVFRRYILHNRARGLERIERGSAKVEPLYIVCSGPSLADTWPEILQRTAGTVWALNGAFDWLCKKGIRPDYGVCLACEEQILGYFQEAAAGDRFLFADQTHPKLVDRVLERGGRVTFWDIAHPKEWGEMPAPLGPLIFGGGTIGSRSFDLAYTLGYREVHVLGMDACLSEDGRIAVDTPMYDDRRDHLRTFAIDGRAFVAMPSHARQVEDMGGILRPLTGMTVTFYGDGLMQWSLGTKTMGDSMSPMSA